MRVIELPAFNAPLRRAERPLPEPREGEVRVRVEACGVCGSDLFLQSGGFGPSTPLPVVPGHEASGVVDAVGADVVTVAVGDQVALYYITTPRGDPWASVGRPNISPDVRRMGVDMDGAFAEYVIRPVEALIVPPEHVPPPILAVLTDAVGTPLHALKRVAFLQPGETLVVVGIGGLGSNAVQLGKTMGASVIAVSRSQAKLELARDLGADAIVASTDDVVDRVRQIAGGHGADVVLQCVGSAAVDEQAIAMGGPGGRIVLVGSSVERFATRSVDLIWRELSVLGSRGFVPEDIEDAVRLYLDGMLATDHMLEAVKPLDDANDALEDLRAGRVLRSILVP